MLAYFILWVSFIISISVFHVNSINYCISSLVMLGITFVSNKRSPVKLSSSAFYLFLLLPSLLCWYIVVIYNNFLCIDSLNTGSLIGIFMLYCHLVYLLSYKLRQNSNS